jgi:hypothetical protein
LQTGRAQRVTHFARADSFCSLRYRPRGIELFEQQ